MRQHDHHVVPSHAKDQGAVSHMHLTIPLKPQDKPANFPPNFTDTLREEYAIKYLERIGASSTAENIAAVLKNLPLEDCHIDTAWKSRGSLADVVTIDLFPQPRTDVRHEFNLSKASYIQRRPDILPQHTNAHAPLGQTKVYHVGAVSMSFDDMKKKFLLPFKHAKSDEIDVLTAFGMKHEEPPPMLPGLPALAHTRPHMVSLIGRRVSQRRMKCFEERAIPPDVKFDAIRHMQNAFYSALPLNALGIRQEREKELLYQMLLDMSTLQLVHTMTKYLYLEVFYNIACLGTAVDLKQFSPPTTNELEALYLTVLDLFTKMRTKLEKEDKGVTLWVPLLLLGVRVVVETIFRTQYPLSFSVTAPTMNFVLAQQDHTITKMLDPDQHYSRIGVLETTCESTKIMASHQFQHKKRQLRLRDQFFMTSESLHNVFPHPVAGKCRKVAVLRGGASIAHYPTLDGRVEAMDDEAPKLSIDGRLKLLRIMEKTHKTIR
ncbi:TPA: hypothetical protein N0F65_001993 [Lagenidium giganteum]|uniref:Uncharacterized protein n=1 Tax=Lagenidium giganteum TaxID=4803 RepID=A0AAV2Z5K9_9STRA|nr:TPA: hypothetical protein N0F65_001993 [Lagenidium giganteum]